MRRVCISFSSILFSQLLTSEEGMFAPQSFVRAEDGTGKEKKDQMFAQVLNKGRGAMTESRQLTEAEELHSPLG